VETLIGTFVAAGLAEFGDKSQLLVIALLLRFGRPGAVLAGVAIGALANAAIAAVGGAAIHDMIMLRALSLLLALALLYAGIAGLIAVRPPALPGWKLPVALTSALAFFLAEFGDKTQFLTLALAARYDAPLLAAAGATAGVIAANLPVLALGARAPDMLPLRAIRIGASACFLLTGSIVAINALRLI
jgi:putative Ca2+/H+ antiporter (TMEM165/GDT1 family)